MRQLGWREFAHHILLHSPHLPERPLQQHFEAFAWRDDPNGLEAWRRGRTGYPLVDAGMRELWATGWMHNRARLVAASFLVKDLLVSWREGEDWFWDTLVDADLADNALGWQWVAGSGADAAPYFRVFNPTIQSHRHDPENASRGAGSRSSARSLRTPPTPSPSSSTARPAPARSPPTPPCAPGRTDATLLLQRHDPRVWPP